MAFTPAQGFSKFCSKYMCLGVLCFIVVSILETPLFAQELYAPGKIYQDFAKGVYKARLINPPKEMPPASFVGPRGKRFSWEDFEGQYVLVNFWATWCGPCLVELPQLEELASKYDKKLTVIGISIDSKKKQRQIARFLENRDIGDFAAYYDDRNEVRRAIAMPVLPTTLILAPDGRLLYLFEGDARWTSLRAQAFVETLLSTKQ